MPVVERPNIVFCVFDSLNIFNSGLLETSIHTPVLSQLKERSALFTHAYTPCPESSPARASIFTGLDPCLHGVWTNGVSLSESVETFPQRMTNAGYANYLVGRRQLAGVSEWTTEKMRPGEYEATDWAHGPLHRSRQNAYLSWLQQTAPEQYARIFTAQANLDNTGVTSEQRAAFEFLPDNMSFNHWVGERATDWIASRPLNCPLLVVAGFSVGSSLGAQPQHDHDGEGMSSQALQQADSAIGRVLKMIATSKRADDTIVIVTSGRGNNGEPGFANVMGEESIRVPLLIHRPGQVPSVISAPISTIDIAPTILQLAGLSGGPRMQGVSLLGVLDGHDKPRGWAMSRIRRVASAKDVRCWQTALCTPTSKLVLHHGTTNNFAPAAINLFNLTADPDAHQDLAGQESSAEESERMLDLMLDARCALEDRTEPRIAQF